jgi:hypothetical protein
MSDPLEDDFIKELEALKELPDATIGSFKIPAARGTCSCDSYGWCPLGKSGRTQHCTADELRDALRYMLKAKTYLHHEPEQETGP